MIRQGGERQGTGLGKGWDQDGFEQLLPGSSNKANAQFLLRPMNDYPGDNGPHTGFETGRPLWRSWQARFRERVAHGGGLSVALLQCDCRGVGKAGLWVGWEGEDLISPISQPMVCSWGQ